MKKKRRPRSRTSKSPGFLTGVLRRLGISRAETKESKSDRGEVSSLPVGESTARLGPVPEDVSDELYSGVSLSGIAPGPEEPPSGTREHQSSDTLRLDLRAEGSARGTSLSRSLSQAGARLPRWRNQRGESSRRVERERRRPRSEGGLFSFIFSLLGTIIRMTVVIILVGAIGAIIGYEGVRFYVKTPEVVVPNVRGMKLPDAFDTLGQKKLGLLKERVEPNTLVAPGEIIEQKPPPGTKAKEGTVVRVVVSSGRANYIVPDVVGETRENAVNKIKGAGLEVGDITYLENETVPRDCVISQNPEANKGLDQPAPVHLLLSKGPPRTPAASGSSLPSPSSSSGQ